MTKHDFLMHHGVKGMKWGVRRYQNYDGTRIGAKKKISDLDLDRKIYKHKENLDTKAYIQRGNDLDFLDDNERTEILNTSSEHADSVNNRYLNDPVTKELNDKLKKVKYGSDEWFDARDEVWKHASKYGEEYGKAILEDIGDLDSYDLTKAQKDKLDRFTKAYADVAYADYAQISDPTDSKGFDVYGFDQTRDYGLEGKVQAREAIKTGILKSIPKDPKIAANISKDIQDAASNSFNYDTYDWDKKLLANNIKQVVKKYPDVLGDFNEKNLFYYEDLIYSLEEIAGKKVR